VRSRADEYFVTGTNAYEELASQRLETGRGYDKRSVETFRARALDLVDELLRQVTELTDRLAVGGHRVLSEAEAELLDSFGPADSFQRREALAALQRPSGNTTSETGDEPDRDDWLSSFGDIVAPPPPAVVDLDLRTPRAPLRVPIRVAPIDGSPRPPTTPTPWGGWVD
jgi:hypothetical protein